MNVLPERFPPKSPKGKLLYSVEFSEWLDTDTLSAVEWESSPSGLTFEDLTNTTTKATATISSGTAGIDYCVTVRITTTTTGEIAEARARLEILDDPC